MCNSCPAINMLNEIKDKLDNIYREIKQTRKDVEKHGFRDTRTQSQIEEARREREMRESWFDH